MIKPIVVVLDPTRNHAIEHGWFLDTPMEIPLSNAALANGTCDLITDLVVCLPLDVSILLSVIVVNAMLSDPVVFPLDPAVFLGSYNLAWMTEDHDLHLPIWKGQETCVYAYLFIEEVESGTVLDQPITVKIGVQQAP